MNTRTKPLIVAAILSVVAIMSLRNAAVAQDANQVRVTLVVTEASRDRAVVGLAKEDFQLWENNVAQEIISMTPGSAAGEYVLAYKSTNAAKDGKWRDLRAKVVNSRGHEISDAMLNVRFKAGYYAPLPGN